MSCATSAVEIGFGPELVAVRRVLGEVSRTTG
jgi:hypothetical protein